MFIKLHALDNDGREYKKGAVCFVNVDQIVALNQSGGMNNGNFTDIIFASYWLNNAIKGPDKSLTYWESISEVMEKIAEAERKGD